MGRPQGETPSPSPPESDPQQQTFEYQPESDPQTFQYQPESDPQPYNTPQNDSYNQPSDPQQNYQAQPSYPPGNDPTTQQQYQQPPPPPQPSPSYPPQNPPNNAMYPPQPAQYPRQNPPNATYPPQPAQYPPNNPQPGFSGRAGYGTQPVNYPPQNPSPAVPQQYPPVPVSPHKPYQNGAAANGFPMQPGFQPMPVQVPPYRPNNIGTVGWSTGLFDCMQDPTNALITACFPCFTFGQIAEIIDSGHTTCGTSGILYGAIACLIGLPCLISCSYRTKLRSKYDLVEAPAPDWVTHCFCEWCALCQAYRELQARGLDPNLGWHGNMAKNQNQQQQVAMTPPMHQNMMG